MSSKPLRLSGRAANDRLHKLTNSMKIFLAGAVALFSVLTSAVSFGQSATPATTTKTYQLTVVIPNVSHREGTLHVGLANDEKTFTAESFKTQTLSVPASGAVQVVFDGLPEGKYAVRIFQDLNGNGKMDFNGQMPGEPFAFSNITMLMGPPSYSDAVFDLSENKVIDVSMMDM